MITVEKEMKTKRGYETMKYDCSRQMSESRMTQLVETFIELVITFWLKRVRRNETRLRRVTAMWDFEKTKHVETTLNDIVIHQVSLSA